MDSLTQLALGAATGEAVLGKKLGNKAVLWGAAAGSLSDMDVIPGMFLDTPDRLLFHRGFSHSIIFIILATIFFAWLFSKIYKHKLISRKEWLFYFGLIFSGSILIDALTTYGTQLLWPLKYRFEFNTIFVVDPLFTLPLLVTLTWLMFKRKDSAIRKRLSNIGLILAGGYLLLTIVNKQVINSVFKNALENQELTYTRMISNPTPLNQLLWTAIAETDSGYMIGYYSHFDRDKNITFAFLPKNHELLFPVNHDPEVNKILRFTKGFYTVEPDSEGFLVNDLRFGKITNWKTGEGDFVFRYNINIASEPVTVTQAEQRFEGGAEVMVQLWQRMLGKKDF
ncbi:MAG: metal-dependent hydrolase [Bacteroidales bacterium]|nr:metal-dependent hydrolase [Bacteroidales bacterium]